MNSISRIPRSPKVWIRDLRLRFVPVACFLLLAFVWAGMWRQQSRIEYGVGQVATVRQEVYSPAGGLIARMPHRTRITLSLFDHVDTGDVLAELDDAQWKIDGDRLRTERKRLRRELAECRRLASEQVQDGAAATLAEVLADPELLLADKVGDFLASNPTSPTATAEEETANDDESDPSDSLPKELTAELASRISVFLTDCQEYDNSLQELAIRGRDLCIRAPISGTLVNIFCSPGQQLHPGAPIATIAADHASYVVSYIPERSTIKPVPGMLVQLRPRSSSVVSYSSAVEQVGGQLVQVPNQLMVGPSAGSWGLPVRIALPPELDLQPGVVIDVAFQRPTDKS